MLRQNRNRPRLSVLVFLLVLVALVTGAAAWLMVAEFPPATRMTEKTLTDVSIKP